MNQRLVLASLLAALASFPAALAAQDAPAPAAAPAAEAEVVLPAPDRPPAGVESAETPEERDRRLIEKHLSPLDRELLNRVILPFVGESNASRARRMEREEEIQRFRERMDGVLRGLKETDPAEYKVVREAYHDTLVRLYREIHGDR